MLNNKLFFIHSSTNITDTEISRRIRSEGFVQSIRDRRQVKRAARALGPEGRKQVGGGQPAILVRILSIFSELLSRVDRNSLNAKERNGQIARGLFDRALAIRELDARPRFASQAESKVGDSDQAVGSTSTKRPEHARRDIRQVETGEARISGSKSARRAARLSQRIYENLALLVSTRRPIDAG